MARARRVQRDQQNLIVTVDQPFQQAPSASPRTDGKDDKKKDSK